MDKLSEEQLAMARMVLRPMPSCKPARPILSTEAQLDQTITDLEQHNEKVRTHILTTSLSHRKPRHPPSSSRPSETKSIINCLQSAHNPSRPAPISSNHTNPPHPPPPPPPPPPRSTSNVHQSAASLARETVERLRVFDDQAGITMAPLYMERERRRREVEMERRRLEVPREFGVGVGVGVGGEGEKGEVKGAGGMVDRSRDPRLRRG